MEGQRREFCEDEPWQDDSKAKTNSASKIESIKLSLPIYVRDGDKGFAGYSTIEPDGACSLNVLPMEDLMEMLPTQLAISLKFTRYHRNIATKFHSLFCAIHEQVAQMKNKEDGGSHEEIAQMKNKQDGGSRELHLLNEKLAALHESIKNELVDFQAKMGKLLDGNTAGATVASETPRSRGRPTKVFASKELNFDSPPISAEKKRARPGQNAQRTPARCQSVQQTGGVECPGVPQAGSAEEAVGPTEYPREAEGGGGGGGTPKPSQLVPIVRSMEGEGFPGSGSAFAADKTPHMRSLEAILLSSEDAACGSWLLSPFNTLDATSLSSAGIAVLVFVLVLVLVLALLHARAGVHLAHEPVARYDEHVRVFPARPVLRGQALRELQEPALRRHVVAHAPVRRVALAHGVEWLVADLGCRLRPLDVGRDVPLRELAVGPEELGRGLQPVPDDGLQEAAQELLLGRLPFPVLPDGVCGAGVFQEVGEDIVRGLQDSVAEDGAAIFNPDKSHWQRRVRQRCQDHSPELLGLVERPVLNAEVPAGGEVGRERCRGGGHGWAPSTGQGRPPGALDYFFSQTNSNGFP